MVKCTMVKVSCPFFYYLVYFYVDCPIVLLENIITETNTLVIFPNFTTKHILISQNVAYT